MTQMRNEDSDYGEYSRSNKQVIDRSPPFLMDYVVSFTL